VSFGYVDSRTDIDDDGGNATAQAGFLGLYGRLEQWGLRLDGTLMAGRHYNDQRRNVTIGTATSTASGNNEGWSLGAGLQVSTPFQLAQRDDYSAVLRPFAGVTTQRYWQDAWSEDGAGTANLAYGSLIHDSFTSRLGAGWEFNIAAGEETRIAPMISLGWAHQFASNAPTMDAAFALLPDQRFSVSGARMDRDSLEVNLGVDVIDFGAGRTFTLGYGGSLARDAQDHTFSARARFAL
jgi:outer membrane autotransporter protein